MRVLAGNMADHQHLGYERAERQVERHRLGRGDQIGSHEHDDERDHHEPVSAPRHSVPRGED